MLRNCVLFKACLLKINFIKGNRLEGYLKTCNTKLKFIFYPKTRPLHLKFNNFTQAIQKKSTTLEKSDAQKSKQTVRFEQNHVI